jgi:diaminopimelate epimerase
MSFAIHCLEGIDMKIEFQKMHGAKNDFVIFDDMKNSVSLSAAIVAHICNRREGVGADGLIVARPSEQADFFMDYMNADGSLAEMCGNGIRCLAKYVFEKGLTDKTSLSIETRAGIKVVDLLADGNGQIGHVRVDMGAPIFDPAKIPVGIDAKSWPILDYALKIEGGTFLCSFVSMGNPHCVILYDGADLADAPRKYGKVIENHPMFPAKINVEFVQVLDRKTVLMRVWERGSGETMACGTGACASAVITILKGLTDNEVSIKLLGGILSIVWKGANNSVVMTGAACRVYDGIITI